MANHRYQTIKPTLAGNLPGGSSTPQRTVYDWVGKYRQAQRLHQCGFVGLLPQWHRCGNRTKKLTEETWALINEFISNNYETLKQKFKYEVYGELVLACERQGVQPPSYKTFVKAVNSRSGEEQTKKRAGPYSTFFFKQKLSELLKIEIDTNPPQGAIVTTTALHRHVRLNLQHHDRASLFAGKLHAILQRAYPKGRGIYDLWWYLSQSNWPEPNLVQLNAVLTQSGWTGPVLSHDNWRSLVRENVAQLDWQEDVSRDIQAFIITADWKQHLNKDALIALLA